MMPFYKRMSNHLWEVRWGISWFFGGQWDSAVKNILAVTPKEYKYLKPVTELLRSAMNLADPNHGLWVFNYNLGD